MKRSNEQLLNWYVSSFHLMSWTNQSKIMMTNCMRVQNKHTTIPRTTTRDWENWDYSEWIGSCEIKRWDEMRWEQLIKSLKNRSTTALWHTNWFERQLERLIILILHLLYSSKASYIIFTSSITKDDETCSKQIDEWREKKEYRLKNVGGGVFIIWPPPYQSNYIWKEQQSTEHTARNRPLLSLWVVTWQPPLRLAQIGLDPAH